MRIMLIALATLATTAIALPIASNAGDTVVIKKGDNGHHYGWRHRHREKKVVVIKERDRHHHRHHHTTTGAGIGVGVHVGD